MVSIEVVGYKKIVKNEKTLYYLSAIAENPPIENEGMLTYNAFVSMEHLEKHGISESSLIGAKGNYYNVKQGNAWSSGITLKK